MSHSYLLYETGSGLPKAANPFLPAHYDFERTYLLLAQHMPQTILRLRIYLVITNVKVLRDDGAFDSAQDKSRPQKKTTTSASSPRVKPCVRIHANKISPTVLVQREHHLPPLKPDVYLHARLRERKVAPAVPRLHLGSEHLFEKVVDRSLEVSQVKISRFLNVKNLDLVSVVLQKTQNVQR